MALARKMPFFHGVTDQMNDEDDKKPVGKSDAGEGSKGDGFHHHEIHEDEAGFHSKHTDPDGKETHADHASYQDAKDHMDSMHGEESDDDSDGNDAGDDSDGDSGDMAKGYGDAADCD
jgi:hypothetical protein